MPDILTHVLVGYILGTFLSFRYEWVGPEYVTLVMLGALTPDLMKIALLLPSATVEAYLGVPFNWRALHVLNGSLVVVLLGVLLVSPRYRKRVFILLTLGATSHHALDLLLINVSGYSYPVLWPLTEYHPPAGMLYLSSDRWPAVVAGAVAAILWLVRRSTDDAS
jgi:uncharacterized membrane protein